MAEFLTTSRISNQIEKIIVNATNKLILISPYLQFSKTLCERLKDAANRGIVIKIIYGKEKNVQKEQNSISDLKNLELYFFENLHAKCYFNEEKMVITSMNMYEFSEKTNREMGVLIDSKNDKEVFEDAIKETLSILQFAERIPLNKTGKAHPTNDWQTNNKSTFVKFQKQEKGYCIRCSSRINYNPYIPYCSDCYSVWSQFSNYDYQENVCHKCGTNEATFMDRPQCHSCFKQWRKTTPLTM